MKTLLYILRIIYRIRLWLIGVPLVVALIAILATSKMGFKYAVNSTIYTGVASGYSIESGVGMVVDWNTINNAMDNIINIIYSQKTLKQVSLRLYARNMINGNPDKDNNYITASHYRQLVAITPKEVQALIVKEAVGDESAEDLTIKNLIAFEQPDSKNFVYGLFNWKHPHYSYEALSKIEVKRLSASDMLEIYYVADDPGIAYNTLLILNDEFVDEYRELRFAETRNVIKYFQEELARTGDTLRVREDALTDYNVAMKVINYDEQTKHIAALTRDFELRYEEILLEFESSKAIVDALDERIDEHSKQILRTSVLNSKMDDISALTTNIATIEAFHNDSLGAYQQELERMREQLKEAEDDIKQYTVNYIVQQYGKEGVANNDVVMQWLDAKLRHTKAGAEKAVMDQRKLELLAQYDYYAPIGSTIKRKERDIHLTENSYLEMMDALHTALMKEKNLQMTSATLKVLNDPVFPVGALPRTRKLIVAASFFGSLIFIMVFFLILELLDRTLRDKIRAERLTLTPVMGAFLGAGKLKYRGYNKECYRIAASYLANATTTFFDSSKPKNIVNIVSTEDSDGKEFVADKLQEQLTGLGLKVKMLSWQNELMANPKKYLQADSIFDLYESKDEDVIIVQHPPLKVSNVPEALLQEGCVNIVTARADRVWKDTDQLLLERLKGQAGEAPVQMYLTQSSRDAVEYFTGMLPPFTAMRKFTYRIFQLGLTSNR